MRLVSFYSGNNQRIPLVQNFNIGNFLLMNSNIHKLFGKRRPISIK
jgi:hypothetical protein